MKRFSRVLSLCLSIVFLAGMLPAKALDEGSSQPDMSYTLHQVGNQLMNGKGKVVRLLGTNVPQLSWSATGDGIVEKVLDVALTDWQSNIIRLAVVPRFWLYGAFQLDSNKNVVKDSNGNPIQTTTKEEYRDLVDKMVAKVTAAGKYVLLDNHSFYLPGQDSEDFWASAAEHFKNHPNVIFGLFNEPTACTWDQWLSGGTVTFDGVTEWGEVQNVTVNSKGLQHLLDIVRSTGANNVVTIGGLNWGFDLTNVTTTHRIHDSASGNGIMFETHPYPQRDPDWDTCIGTAAKEYPIIIGEGGPEKENMSALSDQVYMDNLVKFMDKYEVNLTAWALGAWPNLLIPGKYTPSNYGKIIQNYIIKNQAQKSVTLYDAVDHKGNSLSLNPGSYTAAEIKAMGFDLANLKSIDSKYNTYQYAFVFTENSDGTGKTYTLVSGTKNYTALNIGFKPQAVGIVRFTPQDMLVNNVDSITTDGDNTDINNLVDGELSKWVSVKADGSQTVTINLKKPCMLTDIMISHAGAAGELDAFNTVEYVLSVSGNGKIFTRIAEVKNNNMAVTEHRFDPVVISNIRLTIKTGSLLDATRACLAEVAAYGVSYDGVMPQLPAQITPFPVIDNSGSSTTPDSDSPIIFPDDTTTELTTDTTTTESTSADATTTSKTKKTKATTTAADTDTDADSEGSNTLLIVLICVGAGVVVLGGGGAALYFLKFRKKPE